MAWPSLPERHHTEGRSKWALPVTAPVALATAVLLAFGPAAAARSAYVDTTVHYLQQSQNADGGFAGSAGQPSDPDISAWAAIGLAAAGINPQDQAPRGGSSVFAYLLAHASELERPNSECPHSSCSTELERVLLVVDAAGTAPTDFGGVDLPARLLERELPDGSFSHEPHTQGTVNDTTFAILALSPLPGEAGRVQRAAEWLLAEQDPDGSWPIGCPRRACPEATGEVDATAAVLQALAAARLSGAEATLAQHAEQRGLEFLRTAQVAAEPGGSGGGLAEFPGEAEANVASTAWTAQALWSLGEDPETWSAGSSNPLSYMVAMQQPDGHIRYRRGSDANPVWMTAYTLAAFSGRSLPSVDVPRAQPQPPPVSPEAGQGAITPAGSGSGVIAGGGGAGAPDFSRPQHGGRGRHSTRSPHSASVRSATAAASAPAQAGARPAAPDAPSGRSSATAPAGSGLVVPAARPATTRRGGSSSENGQVEGVLLGGPTTRVAHTEPAGLHSAGEAPASSWPAIGVGIAALVLAAAGAWFERRRPALPGPPAERQAAQQQPSATSLLPESAR